MIHTQPSQPTIQHVEHVMGMAISFDIRTPLPQPAALAAALVWLHHVDEQFSTYKPDSEISRIGRGELGPNEITPEVAGVLARCIELERITSGAFNAFVVPAANGTTLDPSGLVKGWSIEHAAHILERHDAVNFCINAGGDIAIRGEPQPGQPWRIGIRPPNQPDRQAVVIERRGSLAIATSGAYERGAHIIDPHTGEPCTRLASATIIGTDLGDADAFATAAFVMGLAAIDWIEQQPGYDAFLITHDDTTVWTAGFDNREMCS